ncbi:NAD(P)-dependent oxidoreductase [Oenococcus kitaharae]|uniref:Rrf2-linked NADH-flavin reductase n=1 Tax=Oenococcus kitaharae DSM 17330 TaxID=1045004 RepID=G9WG82_9LACO|nr:NAD(P)H-binding protein [Oenococcus kitaharae]EHN59690.1 Rrf2-linked NADH-flavin reductase [Oenococcus kitaharae DSM 17330]OEY83524.1 NADH-flavin reductase [Oenococcus kitaharae]OEY85323.1 NADH-flavin reductase [Oenococcus kitaharae]OEY86177.1 NADH-flavin reductase [Oenococcus kitaharae]
MKLTVIGATGMAGSAIVLEAARRGHDVTAIARSAEKLADLKAKVPTAQTLIKDAFALTKDDLSNSDVVIDAFASSPKTAYLHVDLAAKLVALFRQSSQPRLFFILGAGSLHIGEDHHLAVKDMEKDPQNDSFISVPQNQLKELQFLQNVDDVNWVAVSPAASFHTGAATTILKGKDDLLFNQTGQSETSSGTMAKAILDEIEQENYHQTRFTIADGD